MKNRFAKILRLYTIFIVLTCILFLNISTSAFQDKYSDISYEWIELNPTENPGKLNRLSMAYDVENDKLIMTSGSHFDGTVLNKTWAFDYLTNTWEDRMPSVQIPPRYYSHMTYNSVENTTIIMGGANPRGAIAMNDLWEYDYKTNNWTELASHPSAGLIVPRFTFVDSMNALFLFGGERPLSNTIIQNWWYFFVNNTWKAVSPISMPTTLSTGETHYEVIYHGGKDTILLFKVEDVYEYSIVNNDWIDLNTTGDASSVGITDMIYNPKLDLFYRFGGVIHPHGSDFSGETWIFDYNTKSWEEIIFSGESPASRDTDGNFEFNSKSNVGILYGGGIGIYLEDTWILDIKDSSTTTHVVSSSNPLTSSSSSFQLSESLTTDDKSSTTTSTPTSTSLSFIFVITPIFILIIIRRSRKVN